jgi:transposase
VEKRYLVQFSDNKIRQTLKAAGGNVREAAAALSVGASTFYARLKAMREGVSTKPAKKAAAKKKAVASAKKAPAKKKAAVSAKKAPAKKKAVVRKKAAKKRRS